MRNLLLLLLSTVALLATSSSALSTDRKDAYNRVNITSSQEPKLYSDFCKGYLQGFKDAFKQIKGYTPALPPCPPQPPGVRGFRGGYILGVQHGTAEAQRQ